jgi:hypothetical protein
VSFFARVGPTAGRVQPPSNYNPASEERDGNSEDERSRSQLGIQAHLTDIQPIRHRRAMPLSLIRASSNVLTKLQNVT